MKITKDVHKYAAKQAISEEDPSAWHGGEVEGVCDERSRGDAHKFKHGDNYGK